MAEIRFRAHINEPLPEEPYVAPEPPEAHPDRDPVSPPRAPPPCCPIAPQQPDLLPTILCGIAVAYAVGVITGTLIFSPTTE